MDKLKLNSHIGHLIIGLLALATAYLVAIRAIDTGSLLQYGVLILLFVVAVNNFIKAVRKQG